MISGFRASRCLRLMAFRVEGVGVSAQGFRVMVQVLGPRPPVTPAG